jgi:hypothetical protein
MKQLVYKNIFGNNPRKREVSIEEISDRKTNNLSRKWISKYFIKEKHVEKNSADLKKWIQAEERKCSKDCHILRRFDDRTGENIMVCKVKGDFFVIVDNAAYRILYINEVRVEVADLTGAK